MIEDWFPKSREAIRNSFGDDADLFSRILAGTSPISSIETNMSIAIRTYRHLKWFDELPLTLIYTHYISVSKLLCAPKEAGRKIWSLYQNLIGNEDVCPIDRWMLRYFGYPRNHRVSPSLYDKLENKIRDEAREFGITPSQRQVQIWCESRSKGSTRGHTSYGDLIIKRGINRENILRRLI